VIEAPFSPRRRRDRAAWLRLCAGLSAAVALACGSPDPPSADADWPEGALLSARTEELRRLLLDLESLRHTPLARSARRLREALPACATVEAIALRPAGWAHALRCAEPDAALSGLHAHRAETDAGAAFAVPLSEGDAPRLLLRLARAPERLRLDLRWSPSDHQLASLLPGRDPPGPGVLDDRERLLHTRVRVDGALDLAGLIPAGSQADDLLHLRAEVLGAAILDGTWEMAIYAPLADAGMPRIAVALGVRSEEAAAAAAERLVAEVERHWSVARTPLPAERYTGSCLLDLRVLPELAPCYAATERALVFAWNPASLERALARDGHEPIAAPTREDAAGHLEVDLAGLRETDLRLARRVGPEAVAAVARWPWTRLVASGDRRDGDLSLHFALEHEPTGLAP
jgi:hypothetical protein